MLMTGVAVEKLTFLGGKTEIQFLQIPSERVFQQPRLLSTFICSV
jgi:hypothetical protein